MKAVPLLFLPFCLTAIAGEEERAIAGQAADVATTFGAVANGATEANPLGPYGLLVAKPLAYAWIKSQPKEDQARLFSILSAWGWGAAANNLCVIATGGLCAVIGAIAGMVAWQAGEIEREYWELCKRVKHREPADMEC